MLCGLFVGAPDLVLLALAPMLNFLLISYRSVLIFVIVGYICVDSELTALEGSRRRNRKGREDEQVGERERRMDQL